MSSKKGRQGSSDKPATALYEVRQASEQKGRGAFALKDIRNAGSIIMEEKEAFLAQEKMVDPPLPFLVCEHCLRFIGSVPEQLELITSDLEYESLPASCIEAFKSIEPKLPAYRSCEDCGAAFCDTTCFDKANKLYHKRLCPKTLSPPSEDPAQKALAEFWDLDAEKPNLRLHFAAKMIAMVMAELDENKNQTAAQAREKLLGHWHTAPYSLVIAKQQRLADPTTTDDNLVEVLSKPVSDAERTESDVIFNALMSRPLECLKIALSADLSSVDAADLFSRETFDSMLGIVHLNSVEVHVYSPLHQYLRDALTNQSQAQGPLVQLANMIAERYGGVPRCEGSALFSNYAMANHSCKFNIVARGNAQDEIWSKEQFAKTSWISTGPITKRAELCLPYIDPFGKARADRQRELWKKYSFLCQCSSCMCFNLKCSSLEGKGSALTCSRCKAATYCSKECQLAHWGSHKTHCKSIASK